MTDADRRARALARSGRAILNKARLSDEEQDLSPVAGAAGISLLTRLSLESHQLAGVREPSYTRAQVPVRFVPGRRT